MDPNKLEIFERAFTGRLAGCRLRCHCGKTYFDSHNACYDWERGELEALHAGAGTACDYAPGTIEFEGRTYVNACTCWHNRAEKIAGFIDAHAHEIAEYLSLEKKRKQAEAADAPTVG